MPIIACLRHMFLLLQDFNAQLYGLILKAFCMHAILYHQQHGSLKTYNKECEFDSWNSSSIPT